MSRRGNLSPALLREIEARGGTVRGINLRILSPEAPEPAPVILSPVGDNTGRLIAGFAVVGVRPVPWSVPPKIRQKAPKLIAWQKAVKDAARKAMGTRLPYAGPFESRMSFYLRRRPSMPDLGNLAKGALDPIQEIIIVNDRDQRHEINHYNPDADEDMALIEVWTIGAGS